MMKKLCAKNTGISYLEIIYSIFIIINLFVLFQQIFYNINIEKHINEQKKILVYETAFLRIEQSLKEAENIEVTDNEIKYEYQDLVYKYNIFINRLSLEIGYHDRIYYLENIKSWELSLNDHLLTILIIDLNNAEYVSQVIIHE